MGQAPEVMTPEPPASPAGAGQGLVLHSGNDGSFSLWSETFREGFHSGRGALREARETFVHPSELERFPLGHTITVLEVCVGTGSNLAALLEACNARGLQLDWTGLELDPEPLALALSQPAFRRPWPAQTLVILEQLRQWGCWHNEVEIPGDGVASGGRMLWGDARHTLQQLCRHERARFDLIWHDAFSPQRCPQLWTVDFLGDLTSLLAPAGRWISYSSAAAVREALRLVGLQLAALPSALDPANHRRAWSGGTIASPSALPASPRWRALTPMELEHLASSAAEPYRDPTGSAAAPVILANRHQAQATALADGTRGSSSAWRRRWRLEG